MSGISNIRGFNLFCKKQIATEPRKGFLIFNQQSSNDILYHKSRVIA